MDRPKRTVRKRLRFEDEQSPQPVPSSVRRKEINARYRAKIKSDPAKAAAYKAGEAERLRAYRAILTPEQIKEQNRKRRERYSKKRDEGLVPKNPKASRPKTRASQQAQDDLRERNRQAQRKRRSSMSAQKKRRERERSLAYYYAHKKPSSANPVNSVASQTASPESATVRSSAVYRLRQKLGYGGKKLLLNLQRLIRSTNKSHSSDLHTHGITYSSPTKSHRRSDSTEFRHVVEQLKPLRTKTSLHAKKLIFQAAENIMDKYSLRKYSIHRSRASQPYKRKGTDRTSELITSFYEDNSVYLAGKRSVNSDLQSKKVLDKSIVHLFNEFVRENGSLVARATFYRKRPKHVVSFLKTPYRQCMCDICLNPMIKIHLLNRLYGSRVDCVADLVRMTVCERLKKVCLMRQCVDCGLDGLSELLSVARLRCEDGLEWKRWEKVV